MSVQRGNGQNGGHFYSNITKPIKIDCNFIVDSSNGNGLGIRSLKSNGYINNVFMHTSSTPATNNGYLNPNPASGIIMVQMKNNFNYYLGGFSGFVSPTTSNTTAVTSGLTAGNVYVITVLGTTTTAEWHALGVPASVTPAVGVAFVAITTGTGGSHTGKVGIPSKSGISAIEVIGDSNLSISSNIGTYSGQFIYLQCLGATNSSTTTLIPTAPADGSVIGMSFFFDGSSVTIDGL